MRNKIKALLLGCTLAFAGQVLAQETLNVWWVKGFYKSEDDALLAAIKKYEQKTGVKVELSQYPVQGMIPKTVAALDAGTPPDVAYADVYDFQVAGKWAFDGKLEDISDVITPIKDRFAPNTVETAFLQNDKTKKKAYYGFPLKQQTMHIEYWIDMVKQGLVGALTDYTMPYTKGCTPPSSTSWKDPDNNVAFHNKTTVLTHNATISIAAKWLDDINNETLSAEQRAQAKKNYYELIRTAGFPNKPDGKPMGYRTAVKVGVIFADSRNKARAKEFVSFLLQEENLTPYVEGALGRWFPVTKAEQERPFWQ